tara:strand:- start:1080 stop:1274 length:195 start_codon:yes stop_codon:yes gene_type:complete
MAAGGVDKKINMGDHPYNDMTIEVPSRDKITTKMKGKLDVEYNNPKLKHKQKASYLRSVYYKEA